MLQHFNPLYDLQVVPALVRVTSKDFMASLGGMRPSTSYVRQTVISPIGTYHEKNFGPQFPTTKFSDLVGRDGLSG